jgi:hypothetical protein
LISGTGFWSPGINDTVTFFDLPAAINNSYVTVVTSSNPQTITVRIPASWFTANSVASGFDMGPVVVETPSGTALSLADAVTQ